MFILKNCSNKENLFRIYIFNMRNDQTLFKIIDKYNLTYRRNVNGRILIKSCKLKLNINV